MSTTKDLVRDLNDFLGSVDKLLKTDTAKEAPNIARDLGAVPQLNGALDLVGKGLAKIDDGVVLVSRNLIQVDSMVAGFEILAVSIKDFGKGEALDEVAKLLEVSAEPFKKASAGIEKAGGCLEAALGIADTLPEPGDLLETHGKLKNLQASVAALKASPSLPAANTSLPALTQPT